jgi:hypothetical protein
VLERNDNERLPHNETNTPKALANFSPVLERSDNSGIE